MLISKRGKEWDRVLAVNKVGEGQRGMMAVL
jgi:hypothetical protein